MLLYNSSLRVRLPAAFLLDSSTLTFQRPIMVLKDNAAVFSLAEGLVKTRSFIEMGVLVPLLGDIVLEVYDGSRVPVYDVADNKNPFRIVTESMQNKDASEEPSKGKQKEGTI